MGGGKWWWRDVLEMVVAGGVVASVLLFVAAPYRIRGGSMEPAFHNGDWVVVNKLVFRWRKPEAGEVVIVRTEFGEMVKRVVREVEEGKYWVEGDNKSQSTDSREYGPVEGRDVVGKVGW